MPPVFRDNDFVVLRPEAVRAVAEVKGSLTNRDVNSLLTSFVDFGRKWRGTQLFYKERHQSLTPRPHLLGLAWRIKTDARGRPVTNPSRVRQLIADYYASQVSNAELDGFPILNHLFIYNESDIQEMGYYDDVDGRPRSRAGWASSDGRFVRFDEDGTPYRDRDRTIAALLAAVHISLGMDLFNRFFSYADESHHVNLVPYRHYGFSSWLEKTVDIRRKNTDTV